MRVFWQLVLKKECSVNGELVDCRLKSHKHLPKQVLPLFDGNVKGWIGFWGLFEKVHDNDKL